VNRKEGLYVLASAALPGTLAFISEGLFTHFGVRVIAGLLGVALGAACLTRGIRRRGRPALDAPAARPAIDDTVDEQRILLGSDRQVTAAEWAEQRLAHAATHDALTGLPNRTLLCDRITHAIARAQRNHTSFAVMLIDLDGFKEINDVHGHDVGDDLLRQASALLQGSVRGCDTVARLGGDEFVVLLEDVDGKHGAETVARRIVRRAHEALTCAGGLSVTASIGISMFPRDAGDVQTLMRTADIAMYVQKGAGGNGFAFIANAMREAIEQRSLLKGQLQHAIERGELLLHYQPVIDTSSGAISGMEALLRWRHPTLGMVSPGSFIPIAETSGLIVPIGEWVVREACRQAQRFEQQGLGRLPIAVNLSAKQLNAPNLVSMVLELLAEHDLDTSRLVLEVTESVLMQDEEHAARVLGELHRHGLKISLDDFGTGYSSLARLRALPISTLKIDRSFIRHVADDPADAAIVSAIVAMARGLRMNVVAEGIETAAQLQALRALEARPQGCLCVDEVQGFLFSKPLEPAAIATLLRTRTAATANPVQVTAASASAAG
jgi:diguanylate cyclase (GGDEF)-like protein